MEYGMNMISLEKRDGEIFVMDGYKTQLKILTNNWTDVDGVSNLHREIDELLVGKTDLLRFPESIVFINSTNGNRNVIYRLKDENIHLGVGSHLIQIDANITAFVKFEGDGHIKHIKGNAIELSFPKQIVVNLGFRSHNNSPGSTIQIPATKQGVASAIAVLSNSIGTSKPEKSYPSLRPHPALISFSDQCSEVDAHDVKNLDSSGVRMVLPDNLCHLFIAAPLAYYLQASVVVDDINEARIEIKDTGYDFQLPSFPQFQKSIADTLRRVFLLDCLVRNAGPFGEEINELRLLPEVGIDIESLYSSSYAERLTTYLKIPFGPIANRLPEWHLATYVEPTFEHVLALPFLLDRMSLIYFPQWEQPDRSKLLKKSMDESYRDGGKLFSSTSPNDPLLIPTPNGARIHGWLADGIPIGAFKIHPSQISGPNDISCVDGGPIRIIVVLNDGQMVEEQAAVAEIYRRRAASLSVEVDIEYELSCSELTGIFEQESDFVHYIGHCDAEGLRCVDGNVSASEIQQVRSQTFFLNACGSYQEGYNLIERGGIAGAVTLASVLDEPAATVGTAFAQLLMHGFSIERALEISRRQTVMGLNYTVVGDGTHVISQGEDSLPTLVEVGTKTDGSYKVSVEVFTPRDPGGFYKPYLEKYTKARLFGNETVVNLTRGELRNYLKNAKSPVIFDNNYIWSDDLYRELGKGMN